MAVAGVTTGVATEVVKGIASTIFAGVVQQIKNIVELGENLNLLKTDFMRVEAHLQQIDSYFHEQQRSLPELVVLYLRRMNDALTEGKQLVERAERQRRRCYGCCLPCNPNLNTQVKYWDARFQQLFRDFQQDVSIAANVRDIASASAPHAEVLRQDVPDDIVGTAIESARERLHTWLTEPAHSQARVTGIYGMGGVGKTSVLKLIHNNCKEKVSGCIFDSVIWYTVSKYKSEEEDAKIKELQFSIAYTLHLDLKDCSLDIRKMRLSASLENKRFLLILDDLWDPMDLSKVGVKFGRDKGSKILISSRSRDVIKTMGASDHYSLKMELLSAEEGWQLFSRKTCANGVAPEIETIAKEIARECKGLPLALNVVAAALSSETDVSKWRNTLEFMKNVDPTFPDTHSTIDSQLYQHLRMSYNDLPDYLKSLFLYCAAFPEDAEIEVETLLEMWSAEGFSIRPRGMTQSLDAERQYIDALVRRCLIEYVGVKEIRIPIEELSFAFVEREVIKVHDVLRDMAIYIGERYEGWVFASAQHLQQFPRGEVTRNCRRLSVSHIDIEELPTDLECSTELLCLVLANCNKLTKVPDPSLLRMKSLKVLDLSCTLIESLPTSVGQLGQLQFLNLTGCYLLKELPESICTLSRLQFLKLQFCESLVSLPDKIGDLQSLKHLNFHTRYGECRSNHIWNDECRSIHIWNDECRSTVIQQYGSTVIPRYRSTVIPRGIFGLTSLTKLCLPGISNIQDLKNLSNLLELSIGIAVKPHIFSDCDCGWLKKMRKLTLLYAQDANAGDDVVEDTEMVDILPPLQNMNELRSLHLHQYPGRSLPNHICKLPYLEELRLGGCAELRELPVLEIGGENARGTFPMLKKLTILRCPLLQRLPIGIETFCNLKEICGEKDWWSALIWHDEVARVKLQVLFRENRTAHILLQDYGYVEYSACSIM